jgi:hypothetical protein
MRGGVRGGLAPMPQFTSFVEIIFCLRLTDERHAVLTRAVKSGSRELLGALYD